jgi:hypothetical protein
LPEPFAPVTTQTAPGRALLSGFAAVALAVAWAVFPTVLEE